MNRLIVISLLALATWLYPYKVASANEIAEPIEEPAQFINYEQIRRDSIESNLAKTKTPQSNSSSKSASRVNDSTAYSGRHYSKEEVIELIKEYSVLYGISSETPLCIAKLESGYSQFSKNKSSSASGVFQYLAGTWRATDEGRIGLSVFDADANIRAAVKYMAVHKNTRPWVVAPNCPPLKFIN